MKVDNKPGIEHKIRRFNERKGRTEFWAKELSFCTEKMEVTAVCRWGHEKVYGYDSFIKGNSGNKCTACSKRDSILRDKRRRIKNKIKARKGLIASENSNSEARKVKRELFFELLRNKEYSQLRVKKWKPFIEKHGDSNMMFILDYISYFISRGTSAICPLPTPDNHFWCYDCQTLKPDSDKSPVHKSTKWCYSCYSKWRGIKTRYSYLDKVPDTATPWEKRKRELYLRWLRNSKRRARKLVDPAHRVISNIRTRISDCVRTQGEVKWNDSVYELLQITSVDFLKYLENQFEDWMTWDNYGTQWHVHHIIPLAQANGDLDLIKRLFHYRNLMPLSAEENLRISTNIVPELLTDWHYKNFSDIL